ncbi:MAG: phage portal protein [Betaproteobacteria bacterium]|nr:phage portal protein [Betaproteobacteria bacterium]
MARPAGGTEKPVDGILARLKLGAQIAFGGKGDWFGPGTPIPPSAPEQVEGRQFQLPISYNTLIQSKVDGVGFGQLRMMADTTDIIRLLIELRKDQVCSLEWSIQKKGTRTGRNRVPQGYTDAKAKTLTAFFESPDKDHGWEEWLRFLLEDMFVLDAPCLYVQRTRGGQPYALRPLDGATIKRVIDNHGWTPTPPNPAFQQILQGTAAVDYTTDELIYRPRNPRTNRIYGLGHVEQIIITAKTWLARQASNLEYYDKGSVPDGFLTASKDWTDSKVVAQYEELLNLQLSGQLGTRRQIKVIPNDSKYTSTKAPALMDAYDEWLARIACFCFSVPPTAFVKEVNRATAATANISSLETGLAPTKRWIERLVGHLIEHVLDEPDYEFSFRDKEAQDPLERAQIDNIYLMQGVLVPNEVRADLGYEALPEPEESQPVKPITEAGEGSDGGQPPPGNQPSGGDPMGAAAHKHDHGDLEKADDAPLTKPMRTLADSFEAAFEMMREAVGKQAAWLGKAADGRTHEPGWELFPSGVDTSPLSLAWDDLHTTLTATASNGARAQIVQIMHDEGLTPDDVATAINAESDVSSQAATSAPGLKLDLLNYRDPNAVSWASEHAAKLITTDGNGGELADATRNMIRRTITKALEDKLTNQQITDLLMGDHAFSRARAELIARTEVHNAEGHGGYFGAQRVGMGAKKWLLSGRDDPCPICIGNAAQKWIPINQAFQGGVEAPLQHPRCLCTARYRKKLPD